MKEEMRHMTEEETKNAQAWELRERMRELILEFDAPGMTADEFIKRVIDLGK